MFGELCMIGEPHACTEAAPADRARRSPVLAGCILVGLFVVTWLIALAVWKFDRIEQRWSQPGSS
jgi:hypothetical protein